MKNVIIDQSIQHGQPVIEGTRVPVAVILGALAGGMTFDEIKKEYDITDEDIRAALRYAAELAADEKVISLKKTS
ncbi:MAG: DUF433 domain-containing protein [Actinomycetota bacterium]|nr:DUF433 domain-containing protein [Actinomycetota bacterium]